MKRDRSPGIGRWRCPCPHSEKTLRAGVAALESALLLPICLVGLMALLDLALSVIQHNCLAECARRAARVTIVRGHHSTDATQMGPATWEGTAEEQNPVTDAFRTLLVCMRPEEVRVTVDWPDGANRTGDRVRVNVRYQHHSLVAALLGDGPWNLSASSTMRIVH